MFRTIKPHKNKLKTSGFTLLEIMIVVVVIAILAAITFPSYQNQIQKARRGDAQEALLECAAAQERFFTKSQPSTYMAVADAQAEQVCGWDGTNFVSQEGFYRINIDLTGCGAARFFCYTIVAEAVNGSPQFNDEECRELSIDARGNRAAEDDTGALNTDICWRS